MIIYEDALLRVKQTWWGPWRVVNKTTGATIAPDLLLQEKVGFAWKDIRGRTSLDAQFRRYCEDVLMQTFALAAIAPAGPLGQLFGTSDPEEIADQMIIEADARLRQAGYT